MKSLLVISFFAVAVISLFSCSEKQVMPPPDIYENIAPKGGKEDDNRPIVMRVFNQQGTPLENASVTMINNTDTLQEVTDSNGNCRADLPRTGDWDVSIILPSYIPKDTTLHYNNDTIPKTIVLLQQ